MLGAPPAVLRLCAVEALAPFSVESESWRLGRIGGTCRSGFLSRAGGFFRRGTARSPLRSHVRGSAR